MGKEVVAKTFKDIQTSLVKHSPAILTGVGITGMVGTTVMAVKATPKALELLDKVKEEHEGEKVPPVEVVKATWKLYIPAVVTGVASIACLVKANSISTRRNAALLTAYNLSKTALVEYKDKVVETIGEKKEKAITEAIAEDRLKANPVENNEVILTDNDTVLCYDAYFGRYFQSDKYAIKNAENALNRSIVTNMYASLNEFYTELGLPQVEVGDEVGWNIDDGKIVIDTHFSEASNGKPCLVMRYNVAPAYNYSKFF